MKQFTLFLFLFLAFVLITRFANSQEKLNLQWKFNKGDSYIINIINEKKSRQQVAMQGTKKQKIEKETSFYESEYELKVKNIKDDNAILALTILSFTEKSDSKDKKMTLKAWKKDGKKHSQIELISAKLSSNEQEIKTLLKDIAEAMLDMEITFEITKHGVILASKMLNNPFEKIKAKTLMTRIILKMLKKMLSPEDLSKMLTTELFTLLSPKPVIVNSSWPVQRKYSIMGIDAEGSGTAKITNIINKPGHTVAQIEETIIYQAKTERFSKMLKEMVLEVFKSISPKTKINLDIRFKMDKAFPKTSYSEFNIDDGYNSKTTSKTVKMSMTGIMKMAINQSHFTANMKIDIESNMKLTCKKIINKQQ